MNSLVSRNIVRARIAHPLRNFSAQLISCRGLHTDAEDVRPLEGKDAEDKQSTTENMTENEESHPETEKKTVTMAERDAALMEKWKEREGSLANSEFEGGQVEEGYRRNVKANIFRYI